MKTKKFTTTQLAILGLMTAILLIMAYTPLGYLNIGPLAISFNVIPGCLVLIHFWHSFRDLFHVFSMESVWDIFTKR